MMALANYFDKTALAAAHVLRGFNLEQFEERLCSQCIGIAFDDTASQSSEAQATLDLLVRLLARLYPRLAILALDNNKSLLYQELQTLALSINPDVDLENADSVTLWLVVGDTSLPNTAVPTFYLGSQDWTVGFSPDEPVSSGISDNPFGAGAAACFGAANAFRYVFSEQLSQSDLDHSFNFSLLNYTLDDKNKTGDSSFLNIDLGETHLVGLGAIGNAAVWALARLPEIKGTLHLIDGESLERTNLQRYVLTTQAHDGNLKTDVAKDYFTTANLDVVSHPLHWDNYLQKRNNWRFERVGVGVDTARDRIAIQSSLPKKIFNAWTQISDLGVSRHSNFLQDACLACLYIPSDKGRNHSELVAEAIGLPKKERDIRSYLHNNTPLDRDFLQEIASAQHLQLDDLLEFEGKPLQIFYSEAVCGGMILELGGENGMPEQVEAPMAFQSALAGIMLAAELVIDAGNLRTRSMPTITRFNLLRPIGSPFSEPAVKLSSNLCLCQDKDFQAAYNSKYKQTRSR